MYESHGDITGKFNGVQKILCVSCDELVLTIENEIRLIYPEGA